MNSIKRTISTHLPPMRAYAKFVHELNNWWPREYTWAQEKLQHICIDDRRGGFCHETGPYGFRCDWGRVIAVEAGESIVFTWQIGPTRAPEPNPDKSSEISVRFLPQAIEFEHRHFERHGDGADEYRQAMDSEKGWDYILQCFSGYSRE
ncbi:SRPBCC family protein [Chitinophaga sp.]|uniref:SRPBCC family protein n=1 Tax=Chitinophaga sp. TaxID=1869181 RepID=UPI0031D711D8